MYMMQNDLFIYLCFTKANEHDICHFSSGYKMHSPRFL